jgi:hypothetical protein
MFCHYDMPVVLTQAQHHDAADQLMCVSSTDVCQADSCMYVCVAAGPVNTWPGSTRGRFNSMGTQVSTHYATHRPYKSICSGQRTAQQQCTSVTTTASLCPCLNWQCGQCSV